MSITSRGRTIRPVLGLGVLLVGLTGVGGCGGGGGGGGAAAPTTGQLVVRMHDHPLEDVDHVYVTIERVEVRREVDGAGADDDEDDVAPADRDGGERRRRRGDDDGDDDNDVVEVVSSVPGQYDLLELQHGVEAVLGGGAFEPGRYHSIRLIVARDSKQDLRTLPADQLKNYVVVEGTAHPLVVPSGEQTGLKLGHDFVIEAGVTTTLTLDFDVRRSVHRCGRGHVYRLKPRLRVVPVVETPDAGIVGAVTTTDGSGLPAGTLVSAQQAGVEAATATVGDTGGYTLVLPDGTYDLVAVAPGYGYASILGVTVTGGAASGNQDFAVAPASVGSVYGKVTPAGEDVTVRLVWNGLTVATVGADPTTGDYLLDNVPAGSYTVVAANPSSSSSAAATVTGGAGTQLDFGL